jgi:PAS domain S-box-containing protein
MNCVDGTRSEGPPSSGAPESCVNATPADRDESERRLRLALQASGLTLWDWDVVNDRIAWTPALRALTGLEAQRFDGSRAGLLKLAHPDDRPRLSAALDRALTGPQELGIEYRIVRPDGAVRWVAEHGHVLRDAHGRALRMIGTLADVTRRRHTEDALREERVSAAEDERRRIGHELHDTFGQHLSLMLLQLSTLRRQVEQQPAAHPHLAQIDRLYRTAHELDEALDQVELQLRPPALGELGLEAALIHTANAWTADSGIPIALHDAGLQDLRLPPLMETTVYRVVQEALANVRRHARAQRVVLNIERDDEELRVSIADDGRGFEQAVAAAAPARSRHLGLVGMRERAALVAGALEIQSEPGHGVTVTLRIPLDGPPVH